MALAGLLGLMLSSCAENPFDTDSEPAGTGLNPELQTPAAEQSTPESPAAESVHSPEATSEDPSGTETAAGADSAAEGNDHEPVGTQLPEDLSVPQEWLISTGEAWPESAGHGASMPVLNRQDECLLQEQMPEILGRTATITDTGFGPLGVDAQAQDSYRYLCNFWSRGHYSGRLQLLVAGSGEDAAAIAENFQDQPSTEVQENSVETVKLGDEEFQVLSRWYPVPEHGLYEALFYDADQEAFAVLEVNSLDEEAWEEGSPEQVAEYLGHILAGE
ncbi:hypothetical protein [Nesterenkonia rhizosphaerae]